MPPFQHLVDQPRALDEARRELDAYLRGERAVGAALGANPLCVVLPCHRVVASSGALTGYAGGLAAKEYLLALESRT
jgi:O-6-methylguanine DNA methyltransferase